MRITWEVLTKEQLERVDREARRILESTGLEVFDGELRNVMEKAGARVDAERIRFPSEMIDEALQRVPGTFSLYEISGQECPVAPGESYFDMYSDGLYIGEPGAKQLRPSTKQDVADFAALGQSQSAVDVVPNTCHARDYEGLDQLLHTLEALLANTNKLMNFAPQNAQEARVFHEMTTIASEGRATRERPVWKGCVSTTSPLRLDGDSGEVLRFLSENGIPFITAPCPMCGGTSPFSLIGTLVVQNAENLAIIAMAQTVAEGIPLIMGGASGPMDMRTGNLAYGAPERSLLIRAYIEIHRSYGLPTH